MKKKLSLLFCLFLLFSQAKNFKKIDFNSHIEPEAVPKSAKKFVTNNYPEAYNIRWDFKRKEALYKSDFKVKGDKYKLIFSPEGKLIYFKGNVPVTKLPSKIKKYVKKYYSGFQVSKVEKTTSFKYTTYRIRIDGEFYGTSKHKIIRFDQKGNLLD